MGCDAIRWPARTAGGTTIRGGARRGRSGQHDQSEAPEVRRAAESGAAVPRRRVRGQLRRWGDEPAGPDRAGVPDHGERGGDGQHAPGDGLWTGDGADGSTGRRDYDRPVGEDGDDWTGVRLWSAAVSDSGRGGRWGVTESALSGGER